MAVTDIRARVSQIAFKQEVTPGTDSIAGTPVPADYVTCQASFRFSQDTTPNPVENGAYDDLPPIPGALRAEITVSVPLVGSGAAGTAPEWGKLLRAAGMIETVTAAAVGVPTAASAGTTTTVTVPTATFGSTAQQRRGMPVLLSGNPAAGATDVVLDYTAGGVMTLANSYASALSATTLVQIPANVLYSPTSDDTLESWLTIYAWMDELRHVITGAKASRMAVGLTDGRPAALLMTFTGQVASRYQNVARPGNYTPVTRQPPVWRGGLSRLNRALAACQSANFDMGLRTAYPENPEAAQGFDPAILTGRAPRVTLDPFSHSTNSPTRSGAMDANTPIPYAALWGSVAGNRFALCTPSAVIVDLNPQERNELGVDAIALAPDQPNAGWFLACF